MCRLLPRPANAAPYLRYLSALCQYRLKLRAPLWSPRPEYCGSRRPSGPFVPVVDQPRASMWSFPSTALHETERDGRAIHID